MVAIRITAVDEDRRVVIQLPPDAPTGNVELEIVVHPAPSTGLTREELRARLLAAGALSIVDDSADGVPEFSDEELDALPLIDTGDVPSHILIDQERGERSETYTLGIYDHSDR